MIRAIVTDIEGTTSSLSFVKDELFPYARSHIASFIREHADDGTVSALLNDARVLLADQHQVSAEDLTLEAVIQGLEQWIDEDLKLTPLKTLQGMIWEAGYKQRDFYGHIYPDAEQALRQWQQQGVALYVYSSGSVHAQKLLFSHTRAGDLTPLFNGYFDTTTGAKQDPESYRKIASAIKLPPGEILFLSDIEAELDAALQAGMQTCCLVREGQLNSEAQHQQVNDFSMVSPG